MRWIALVLLLLAPAGVAQDDGGSEIEIGGKPDPKDAPDPADKPLDREPIPARADGAKIEWTAVRSRNEQFTLHVPSDWRLRETPGKGDVVAFEVMAPGARVPATLDVQSVPGQVPPLSLVLDGLADARKHDERARVVPQPRPYALLETYGDDPKRTAYVPVRVRGNGFILRLQAIRGDYECFARDYFEIVGRLETSLPDWPVIPDSYETRAKGAFVFAVDPTAHDSLKDLQKIAARTEKSFTKLHGKPPRDTVTPVLYLHRTHSQGLALMPGLKDATGISHSDYSGQRAFFCEFKADANKDRADVAREVAELCYLRRYGLIEPVWIRVGERELAAMREYGNLKPPKVHVGYRDWVGKASIPSLRDLQRTPSGEFSQEGVYQSVYYVLLFHCGPSRYRSAYRKFLEACVETGDVDGAFDKHFEPLGFDKLQEECDRFRKSKLEYVEPKSR